MVSITCIFLAYKVEEDLRKLKEVIIVGHSVKTNNFEEQLSEKDELFKKLSDKVVQILVCERILLHTLSFDVNVIHPHNIALKYVKRIQGGPKFRQAVWNFMNDCSNTNLCLRFAPEAIAAAGVLLAAHYVKVRGENKDDETKRALANLDQEFKENDGKLFNFPPNVLKSIASELLTVYEPTEALFQSEESVIESKPDVQGHNKNTDSTEAQPIQDSPTKRAKTTE